jgi:hypothetical protein
MGKSITLDGWRFERVSGAYIDITPPGSRSAVEVINCWNYAEGEPEVPDTLAALREAAREWLDDLDEHDAHAYKVEAHYHDAARTPGLHRSERYARETAPQYWTAGAGLETPHETADRLQQSSHDLNRALADILTGILDRDALAAITTTADAIEALEADTAAMLDRYYATPDEDPAAW